MPTCVCLRNANLRMYNVFFINLVGQNCNYRNNSRMYEKIGLNRSLKYDENVFEIRINGQV